MTSSRPLLKVDLSAIRENYRIFQKECGNATVGAAVKADCYGLGFAPISKILESEGCRDFFVASSLEGIALRAVLNQSANIYVLNGVFDDDAKEMIVHNLIPALSNLPQIKLWQKMAEKIKTTLPCLLHFNTGINRFGIVTDNIEGLAENIKTSSLNVLYVMSHLVSSEEKDNPLNKIQLERFNQIAAHFPNSKKSLSNSGGIFLGKEYHFDLVRPGAGLYGLNPAPYLPKNPMHNTATLLAPIIQLQEVEAGEAIGYNETYQVKERGTFATIPIGYADGYMRALSNNGITYIKEQEASIVGRISMDLTVLDVSNIDPAMLYLGQMVEVMGNNIPPDKIAHLCGTSGYEILTMLGNRFQRRYN